MADRGYRLSDRTIKRLLRGQELMSHMGFPSSFVIADVFSKAHAIDAHKMVYLTEAPPCAWPAELRTPAQQAQIRELLEKNGG
jgi:hypothetical protein